jgi:sec-independent protein translocase protein TatB
MFNVGGGELLVILLIALMVLGPDRLPGFAKKAGKVLGEVRRISHGFQSEIKQAMDFHDDEGTSRPKPVSPPSAADPPRLVEPPAPAAGPPIGASSDDADASAPSPPGRSGSGEGPDGASSSGSSAA